MAINVLTNEFSLSPASNLDNKTTSSPLAGDEGSFKKILQHSEKAQLNSTEKGKPLSANANRLNSAEWSSASKGIAKNISHSMGPASSLFGNTQLSHVVNKELNAELTPINHKSGNLLAAQSKITQDLVNPKMASRLLPANGKNNTATTDTDVLTTRSPSKFGHTEAIYQEPRVNGSPKLTDTRFSAGTSTVRSQQAAESNLLAKNDDSLKNNVKTNLDYSGSKFNTHITKPDTKLESNLLELDTKTAKSEPKNATTTSTLDSQKIDGVTKFAKEVDLNTKTAKSEPKLNATVSALDSKTMKEGQFDTKLSSIANLNTKSAKAQPALVTSQSNLAVPTKNAKHLAPEHALASTSKLDTKSIIDEPQLTSVLSNEDAAEHVWSARPSKSTAQSMLNRQSVKNESESLVKNVSSKHINAQPKTVPSALNNTELNTQAIKSEPTLNTVKSGIDDTFVKNEQKSDVARDINSTHEKIEPKLVTTSLIVEPNTVMPEQKLTASASIESEQKTTSAELKQKSAESKADPLLAAITSELIATPSDLILSTVTSEPKYTLATASVDIHSARTEPNIVTTSPQIDALNSKPVSDLSTMNTTIPLVDVDTNTVKSDKPLMSELTTFDRQNDLVKSDTKPTSWATTFASNITSAMQQIFQSKAPTSESSLNTDSLNSPVSQLNMPSQPQVSTPAPTVTLPVAVNNPQWQESLGQQIMLFSKQDIQKAEIRLHPEELGSLHIKLEMNDGKMQLQMAAAHSVVRGILESAIPHLRSSLAEQGIDLQQTNISNSSTSDSSSQQSMFSQNRQAEQGRSQSFANNDLDITEADSLAIAEATSRSGLSVFA